jgi:hypothetical protein
LSPKICKIDLDIVSDYLKDLYLYEHFSYPN